MSVIAIDSSSRERALVMRTTIAGDVIEMRELPGGSLDTSLPAAIAWLLDAELEGVVVLTGPGSYTGVRAGMAAALGLATARGLPLHGVGTLVALGAVADLADGPCTAVADAGRGGVYAVDLVRRDGAIVEVPGSLRRLTVGALTAIRVPLVATTPFEGIAVMVVPAATVLAAAVPLARGRPALDSAGLTAVMVPAADSRASG